MLTKIGEAVLMLVRAVVALPHAFADRRRVLEQIVHIGTASVLMVAIMAVFIGGVLTLQSGPELAKLGQAHLLGAIVGVGMLKELGPVMIAILITGRVGSAMAAELASMRVYQEVDALVTMNIEPVRFLVMPRIVAMVVALPILTLCGDVIGWAGGAIVAQVNMDIDVPWEVFFEHLKENVEWKHVRHGMAKSLTFAVLIATTCCHIGLRARGGPREIGRAVTEAVVSTIVLILTFDYIITRVLL